MNVYDKLQLPSMSRSSLLYFSGWMAASRLAGWMDGNRNNRSLTQFSEAGTRLSLAIKQLLHLFCQFGLLGPPGATWGLSGPVLGQFVELGTNFAGLRPP